MIVISFIPNMTTVSDTANEPQHDIGNYFGFYVYIHIYIYIYISMFVSFTQKRGVGLAG